jgi:3',5'-cyclic AMP phosphodiesterase CpdA
MKRKTFLQMLGLGAVPLVSAWGRPVNSAESASLPTTRLPRRAKGGSWSVVVLPDSQKYSYAHPEVFMSQTEWISASREARDIRFVLHAGDITDRNSHPEWMNARRAMDILVKTGIPFVMVPGNHDLGEWGSSRNRHSLMSDYFTVADCGGAKALGFFELGKIENTWQTFETPWGPFMVIALEFYPRDEVVAWASEAVQAHADHRAILLTHAYLYSDNSRYDWAAKQTAQRWGAGTYGLAQLPGGVNDGEQLWQKLVSPHANFCMTLNGHVLNHGTGYLQSVGAQGNRVHQMLANYQTGVEPDRGPGGGGYFRILEFQPDGATVEVKTYSPWFDQWLEDEANQFTLKLSQ